LQRLQSANITYNLPKAKEKGTKPKTVQLFVDDNIHLTDSVLEATMLEFPIPDELLIELLKKRLTSPKSDVFLPRLEDFVHKRTLNFDTAIKNFEILGYKLSIQEEKTLIFQKV